MNNDKIRGIIAIMVIAFILIVLSLLTLQHLLIGEPTDIDLIKTWSSIWSGVLGIIIGYYFGKSDK